MSMFGKDTRTKKSAEDMKRYVFEAPKTQLEKPTEPKYVFCPAARVSVLAENEAQAKRLAEEKLAEAFAGTGVILGEPRLTESYPQPEDWSYGYGADRKSGRTGSIGDLTGKNVIR